MTEKRRTRRDFLQNVIITLLSVSAVLLFAQTQLYTLGGGTGFLSFLAGPSAQSDPAATIHTDTLSVPVRVAVTGTYGRYGSIALTSSDESFEPLARLLGDVLGTAKSTSSCAKEDFLSALGTTSVYYDFLSPLPLPILADLANITVASGSTARCVVVAEEEAGVCLYLWDGGSGYLRGDTALSLQDLTTVVDSYELGNAQFAMDLVRTESSAQSIAPHSLFLETTPTLPVLSETVPAADSAHLLTALQFNPNTQSRYTESNGTEVIRDGSRTLRILTDGSVQYQSGSDPVLTIDAAGEQPSLQEAAAGASKLLHTMLGSAAGEASLYLDGILQTDTGCTLTFSYQVGGIPIRFSDGESAAEVTLSGATVSALTLRVRQFSSAGSDSLLLPLRQALAIAARHAGAELSIGYASDGSGTVSAGWLVD